jgi:hypothetical protein
LIYYAGQPGRLTQDRDKLGGNPFAERAVEVLPESCRSRLTEFTERAGAGQRAAQRRLAELQIPARSDPKWKMDARRTGKARALVLINADYSKSGGLFAARRTVRCEA